MYHVVIPEESQNFQAHSLSAQESRAESALDAYRPVESVSQLLVDSQSLPHLGPTLSANHTFLKQPQNATDYTKTLEKCCSADWNKRQTAMPVNFTVGATDEAV